MSDLKLQDGGTALLVAVLKGSVEMIKTLVEAGAELNAQAQQKVQS